MPNFVPISQTVAEIWPILQDGGHPPAWIFYACLDHPQRVFGGLCDCAKFVCKWRGNFNSMQVLIFCALSLKMPIHTAKIGVFEDFTPKMGSSMNETPKTLFCTETCHMTYKSLTLDHCCGLSGVSTSRKIKPNKNCKVY